MSSSSASSSPSPSPSPSPPPPKSKKRKQQPIEEVESSDSSSDSEGGDVPEAGDDADATVTAPSERESSPEVISHAERRKRKKQEKKAVKDSADADSPRAKKRKGEDGAAVPASKSDASNGKLKRQNSVWVGNMSFQSTPDSLRVFFDGVGEITRIHMPMKPGKGENMGFAYVDFSSPDAKIIAIALSERPLEGRNLLIKDGGDFSGRPAQKTEPPPGAEAPAADGAEPTANGIPGKKQQTGMTKTAQKILRIQKQPPAPTLFLGNLGFETTEESIRNLFEAHRHPWGSGKGKGKDDDDSDGDSEADAGTGAGEAAGAAWIRKVRMGTFEDSGKCKGFAFVDFTSSEHATAALVNPRNHRLNGRELVVEYASADAVRRGGGGGGGGGGSGPRQESKGRPQKKEREQQRQANGKWADRAPRSKPAQQEDGEGDGEGGEVDTRSFKRDRPLHAKSFDRGSRPQKRAKPGAALAKAPRETAAILPSQGQKIVF